MDNSPSAQTIATAMFNARTQSSNYFFGSLQSHLLRLRCPRERFLKSFPRFSALLRPAVPAADPGKSATVCVISLARGIIFRVADRNTEKGRAPCQTVQLSAGSPPASGSFSQGAAPTGRAPPVRPRIRRSEGSAQRGEDMLPKDR